MKPLVSCLLFAFIANVSSTAGAAAAGDPWAGQSFLADYSQLQPMPGKDGRDFMHIAPEAEAVLPRIRSIMFDQPEVFISPDSPYKGAKPDDLAAIASVVRDTFSRQLKARGYQIVDQPGPDVLYVRMAITDLKIDKKKRNLLAYTPVGFVVDTGVKALQDFMDKYDVLDMTAQSEVRDSTTGKVLGAAVIRRGESVGGDKAYRFDTVMAVVEEYGARFACRLDNGRVPADQRIDCLDPAARSARPLLVGG
jgi:Protein of unknown function (DUF3313)